MSSTPEQLHEAYLKVRERITGPPVRIRNSLHTLEWLEREHLELEAQANRVCKWSIDGERWTGACGANWAVFGVATGDTMHYCPKCGGKIEV